jgi:hypothetical protein
MRRTPLLGPRSLALGAAAILAAQGISAQEAIHNPVLDRMHDEAMAPAYTSAPGSIERAAWGHAPIAFQRGENDVRRFECLRVQAELFGALGYADGARLYLVEAAQHAEATDDPFNAAMTYVDAAILAKDSGASWEAVELAAKARALVSNQELDLNQRAEILDRLQPRS